MTVKQLIELLKEENQEAQVRIQVSYKTGYIESNKVEFAGGSDDEITLFGDYTDGDSI